MPKARGSKSGRYVKNNGRGSPEFQRFADVVHNAITSRSQLFKQYLDPRRDIDQECGYPKTESITSQNYRLLYDRESVATRVVQVFPKESWQVQPEVYETEEVDKNTEFEEAWKELGRSLRGTSWYQDTEGSPVWEHLRRADELSGVGSYGVLLLGISDGADLKDPAPIVNQQGESSGANLLFLRSFDESLVKISRYEADVANPRFGQPTEYTITFSDPADQIEGVVGLPNATQVVHWTRVIHLADNLGSSEIFGVPRMRPVFNRLLDLRKLYGGSAEMYWKGAFPGLSIETHPQLGGDVSIDASAVRTQMESYMTGLQRYLTLMGVSAKSLSPQVVDPTPQIDTQIEAICIRLGIPKRIFVGSERGELASGQDAIAWNDRVKDRQNGYLTPRVIVPFIDRLIALGVLPQPEGYSVVWPELDALTDEQKAGIAVKRTEALAKYVQGGVEGVFAPLDYLVRILGMPQEEAEAVIETAVKKYDEGQAERDAVAAAVAKEELDETPE